MKTTYETVTSTKYAPTQEEIRKDVVDFTGLTKDEARHLKFSNIKCVDASDGDYFWSVTIEGSKELITHINNAE